MKFWVVGMQDQVRIKLTVERIKSEIQRLKDVDAPIIDDKDEIVFKTSFPFQNFIVENFDGIHYEYSQKAEQLYKFFEHSPDNYIKNGEYQVNIGKYYTYPLYQNRKPRKWFEAMFPYTTKQLFDTPEIVNAAFVIADAESGVAPHYGPKAEDPKWPCLRGQAILVSENESLLCQLKDDKIYMKNQIEGDNFYFDDTDLHWINNYSNMKRVVLLYDFVTENVSNLNDSIYNLALHK